ncbi:hypothetical protein AVEN_214530-1, partial [Araneus ventricosus]
TEKTETILIAVEEFFQYSLHRSYGHCEHWWKVKASVEIGLIVVYVVLSVSSALKMGKSLPSRLKHREDWTFLIAVEEFFQYSLHRSCGHCEHWWKVKASVEIGLLGVCVLLSVSSVLKKGKSLPSRLK